VTERPGAAAPAFARRLLGFLDRVSTWMAYLGGAFLLLISFYITADVLGRKFVGVSSMATDEVGGYGLAVGGLWALAFCLATGAHVRIDILLPHFPARLREVLNYTALLLLTAFAAIVAWYVWKLTVESFTTDARAMSFLRTPLALPQTCMALGFTLLTVQGAVMFLVGVTESVRRRTLAPLPVLQVENLTEGL
jgi:TRAP-type mannitol/chloroaromatic compound transport system permease small subunit